MPDIVPPRANTDHEAIRAQRQKKKGLTKPGAAMEHLVPDSAFAEFNITAEMKRNVVRRTATHYANDVDQFLETIDMLGLTPEDGRATWFCTQCRDHVDWEDLDMTWFEAGSSICVMCAKASPYKVGD